MRYGTYVTASQLAAKELIPIEAEYRKAVERVIQLLLKRLADGAYFVEKEKFKADVMPVFISLRAQFAKPLDPEKATALEVSVIDARLKEIQIEQEMEKIAAHEKKQKDDIYAFCKEIVYDMADAAVEASWKEANDPNTFIERHVLQSTEDTHRVFYKDIKAAFLAQTSNGDTKALRACLTSKFGPYTTIKKDGEIQKGWKCMIFN